MAKTSKQHDLNHIAAAGSGSDLVQVPMVRDDQSFDGRQAQRLHDMERHLEAEMRRKKRDWEREVQRMREEFLLLYPDDDDPGDWTPSEDSAKSSFVVRRKGSTDVLDVKKMRTLIVDSLETGRKFKVRFNVSGFDPKSIQVSTDGERIIVRAVKVVTDDHGHETGRQEFSRKIMKPKDIDHTKFKSYLTSDSVLIVESPFPGSNHDLRRTIHSPSHSHHGGGGGAGAGGGTAQHASPSRSCSPSNSVGQDGAGTPSREKIGVPIFREEECGRRRMHLVVELGTGFSPPEIVVQAIKDNKVMVKAKHEEKTTERLSKNKYCKEFELGEKIDNYSLTASLEPDGRLIVGASVKVHGKKAASAAAVSVEEGGSASGPEDGHGGSKHSSPQHHTVVVKAGDGKGEA